VGVFPDSASEVSDSVEDPDAVNAEDLADLDARDLDDRDEEADPEDSEAAR
jgi:hypothetical protein